MPTATAVDAESPGEVGATAGVTAGSPRRRPHELDDEQHPHDLDQHHGLQVGVVLDA